MKFVQERMEFDIKGNPRIRYFCPECGATVGISPVGVKKNFDGGKCPHCGEKLETKGEEK